MQPLRIQDPIVRAIHIGLDLGQSQDFSAISILEHESRIVGKNPNFTLRTESHLNLLYLQRIPLGTPYPEVVKRIEGIVRSQELVYTRNRLLVDATGVGAPVFDLLEQAKLGIPITGVQITSGEDIRQSGKRLYIPKKDLISNLQLQFQKQSLHIPKKLPHVDHLLRELREFTQKTGPKGRDRYNGPHDDLVLATALAAWPTSDRQYGEQPRRLL